MSASTVWVAGLLIFITSVVNAQDKAEADRENRPNPESLLVESYLLGRQLVPSERAFHLSYLAEAASDIEPGLDRLWSEELFRLTFQLTPSWNRVALQKDAVQALAPVDPDRALELLSAMDTPVPLQSGSLPEDLRAYAARTVFPAYWRRHGEKALDRIRQDAQRIGATGQYPFRAMAPILLDIGKRDSAAADELFGEALGDYSQGSVVQNSDRVFVDFLDTVWQVISPSLQRQALLVAVPNLLHSSQPKGVSYRARIYTDRGIAELKNPSTELLYHLLPKIREIDPEWAKRVEDQLPSLRQVGSSSGHTKMVAEATVVNTSNASPEQIAVLQERLLQGQRADEARNLARTDQEGALELALSLSDPEFRAEALASVAEALSEKGQDPERARDLVRQAKDNMDRITDKAAKVEVFSSLAAAAAAAGDMTTAREALRHGFDLGEEAFQAFMDNHPGTLAYEAPVFDPLGKLTRVGVRTDRENTLEYITHLQDQLLHAYLLIDAAEEIHRLQPPVHANHT